MTNCVVTRAIFTKWTDEDEKVLRATRRERALADATKAASDLRDMALADEWLMSMVTGIGPVGSIDTSDDDYPSPVVVLQTKDGLMEVMSMRGELCITPCKREVDKLTMIQ